MRGPIVVRLVCGLAVLVGGVSGYTVGDRATGPRDTAAARTGVGVATVAPPTTRVARCFGAAAADPARPCRNPHLRTVVVPTPRDASAAQHTGGCRRRLDRGLLRICLWGTPIATATRTVALVGDSHASQWRAAMGPVVAARRWRAISISRAACPLTRARVVLPGAARRAKCREWNRQVLRWLTAHRSISAVFAGGHLIRVRPRPAETMAATRRGGYAAAWTALRAGGVRHVVVLRDTPRVFGATLRCVDRALAVHADAGSECALPRRAALRPDPMVQAAARLPGLVQVADLSALFCGPARCRPVIGGALVLRDVSHMTTTFSASLGPYLRATVDRLSARWGDDGRASARDR